MTFHHNIKRWVRPPYQPLASVHGQHIYHVLNLHFSVLILFSSVYTSWLHILFGYLISRDSCHGVTGGMTQRVSPAFHASDTCVITRFYQVLAVVAQSHFIYITYQVLSVVAHTVTLHLILLCDTCVYGVLRNPALLSTHRTIYNPFVSGLCVIALVGASSLFSRSISGRLRVASSQPSRSTVRLRGLPRAYA